MAKIDATDRRILTLLQQKGKSTTKEIGEATGLSNTPAYERVRRLEKEGVIKTYVALLDKEKIGYRLMAFCNIQLKEHTHDYLKQFETQILSFPEVLECYHIAGMYDYLLKVVTTDMKSYQEFIVSKLARLPDIGNVQSSFVMTEIKNSTSFPLPGTGD